MTKVLIATDKPFAPVAVNGIREIVEAQGYELVLLEKYMKKIYKQLNLTARSYHKILKVARTLADMDGSENILDAHLNEAVCYRNIDKRFWRDSL